MKQLGNDFKKVSGAVLSTAYSDQLGQYRVYFDAEKGPYISFVNIIAILDHVYFYSENVL